VPRATWNKDVEALWQVLGSRPHAYHPLLAKIVGGVKAGVFLSQLLYWNDKGWSPDKWIWKTANEWYDETALTRKEQMGARRKLKTLGVIEEHLEGVPAILHYRVSFLKLTELITAYLREEAGST